MTAPPTQAPALRPRPARPAASRAQAPISPAPRRRVAAGPPPAQPTRRRAAAPAPEAPATRASAAAAARPKPATRARPRASATGPEALAKRSAALKKGLEAIITFVDGPARRGQATACADSLLLAVPKGQRGPQVSAFLHAAGAKQPPGRLQEMAEDAGVELATSIKALNAEIRALNPP